MEMVLAGRFLSADEALAHGLCSRVVAREALRDEAIALAAVIASRPPVATRLAKRAVADAFETALEEGAERERDAFERAFATEDAARGHAGVPREALAGLEGTMSAPRTERSSSSGPAPSRRSASTGLRSRTR